MESFNKKIHNNDNIIQIEAYIEKDSRNVYHKGKHSYNVKNALRIQYIKEKKEMQRESQKQSYLYKFHQRIENSDGIDRLL